jgi:Proteasome activator pa28 beta subunit
VISYSASLSFHFLFGVPFLCQHPQSFQVDAKKAAIDEIEKSPELLQKLYATSAQYFPATASLSTIQQQYAKTVDGSAVTKNDSLDAAISATLDSADAVINVITIFQQYVALSIPEVESGNFGLGIQLEALKTQGDVLSKINSVVDELMKYSSARAEAIEKLKLPSGSETATTTSSSSDGASTGGEKGDTKTTSTSNSTERKAIETISKPPTIESMYRTLALVAVDVAFYAKAKSSLQTIILGYIAIASFMDKNSKKIEKPMNERAGGYGNMY